MMKFIFNDSKLAVLMGFRFFLGVLYVFAAFAPFTSAQALTPSLQAVKEKLTPHKALYDINLVATRSGSQIVNISGQMFYEWKPACDAWITDHRFNLFYEYADSPGMRITSDFSTYETFDSKEFSYSARRKRNGDLYEEVRGKVDLNAAKPQAMFSVPEGLAYDLSPESMFPMSHTIQMIERAQRGEKIFNSAVFDGSDKDGPVEISALIGKPANAMGIVEANKALDMSLINTPAWNARMAVFPMASQEESADYEMNLVFHENGLISDMLIEYDDFSVTQKLVALEKLDIQQCGSPNQAKKQEPKGQKD